MLHPGIDGEKPHPVPLTVKINPTGTNSQEITN